MTLSVWLVFGAMTAAVVLALVWPLFRARAQRSNLDVAVYRDQLDELERDIAAGRIGPREAEAARVEISRRLIAAADADATEDRTASAGAPRLRQATAVVTMLLLPFGAGALYAKIGSPYLPDHPKSSTIAFNPHDSIHDAVAKVEVYLGQNPDDGQGWEVVAPIYLQQGRFADAVKARRNALRLLGETAERQVNLGEAIIASSNGIVTSDAKSALERAVALNSQEYRAKSYLALAHEQDGKPAEAAALWRSILEQVPANAPLAAAVRRAIARVEGQAPAKEGGAAAAPKQQPQEQAAGGAQVAQNERGPTREDMDAARQLTPEQREEMVRGMVARLAERLKEDGSDLNGWLRLIRAYVVMNDKPAAQGALADARKALAGDAEKLARLEEVAKSLGVATEAGKGGS